MMNNSKDTTKRIRKSYVRDLGDGVTLRAEVSPCVFMYPGYPLQITVTLQRLLGENLGVAYAVNRTKTATTYTEATVKRLLASVRIVPCSSCSTPAFDPATIDTNRGGLCEACFLAALEAKCAAEEKAEQRMIASRDQSMKRKGMVVRVTAWIHPQNGGDDYQAEWYFDTHPTPEQIGDVLRKEGSSVLDDYRIVQL